MFVVCERWVGDEDRLLYLDPSSFRNHSSTSSSSGVAQPWVTEGPKPSVCSKFSLGILSPTDLNRLCTWLYGCLTTTCFRCSSAYLHRWISWLKYRTCLLGILSSHLHSGCGTPSQGSPKNRCSNFWPVLTSPWLVPNWVSFSSFLSCVHSHGSPLEFLSANQSQRPSCCWYISIFKLGICCYPDLNLGTLWV